MQLSEIPNDIASSLSYHQKQALLEWERSGKVRRRWIVGVLSFIAGFLLGAIIL